MKNKTLIALFALIAWPLAAADLTLTWKDNSTNEAGFAIERSPGVGTPNFSEIARVGANVTTYTDTGLPPSTVFLYRVRAWNAGGYSAFTATATGTTVIAPPTGAPSDLNVTTVTVVVTISTVPAGTVATVSTNAPPQG